jgi:hypothetical protein
MLQCSHFTGEDIFQGCDQSRTVEFRDIIVETSLAPAFDRGRRHHGRQGQDRHLAEPRIAAQRLAELEAVDFRHLDVADDRVELVAVFQQFERLLRARQVVTS